MGNDTVPLQSPGFEWQWQSVKAEFKNGSDLSDEQRQHLRLTFNEEHGYDITDEDLRSWATSGSDSEFPAQDLTLYTFKNTRTGDFVHVWNYGLGDNDYGTLHFALDAEGFDGFHTLGKNDDGDLEFYDVDSQLPETASEDTRKVLAAVLKWFNAIEDWPTLAEEVAKKLEPGRSMASLKWKAPTCDPDTWKAIAGWGEDEDPE